MCAGAVTAGVERETEEVDWDILSLGGWVGQKTITNIEDTGMHPSKRSAVRLVAVDMTGGCDVGISKEINIRTTLRLRNSKIHNRKFLGLSR